MNEKDPPKHRSNDMKALISSNKMIKQWWKNTFDNALTVLSIPLRLGMIK